MNIGRRIQVGFAIVIGISVLLGVSALYELSQIDLRADRMGDDPLPGILLSSRIESGQSKSIVPGSRSAMASSSCCSTCSACSSWTSSLRSTSRPSRWTPPPRAAPRTMNPW